MVWNVSSIAQRAPGARTSSRSVVFSDNSSSKCGCSTRCRAGKRGATSHGRTPSNLLVDQARTAGNTPGTFSTSWSWSYSEVLLVSRMKMTETKATAASRANISERPMLP